MNADFWFEVQLADRAGSPICKQVAVDVVAFLNGHARYRFCLGTTDLSGLMRVDFQKIEEARQSNQKHNLMDYNTFLTDCDSVIEIVAPSAKELAARFAAVRKWFQDENSTGDVARPRNDEVKCDLLRVDVETMSGQRLNLVCEAV
jgi:hypothetical protein